MTPPPRFCRCERVPFVREEVFQAREEKGTKPSAIRIRSTEVILLQETAEELLRQILRLFRIVPLAADKNLKQIPVRPAEFVQGRRSVRRVRLAGVQNDSPERRGEGCVLRDF